MVIPFTYNILKRHPKLMPMIHRSDYDGAEEGANTVLCTHFESPNQPFLSDPFLPLESDPQQTNALASSLWELATHRQHYHAGVSTLAKIFSEAFTKPSYAMEDFLDHTYGTVSERFSLLKFSPFFPVLLRRLPLHRLPVRVASHNLLTHLLQLFETEAKRKIKKEPALALDMGKDLERLFPVTKEDRPTMEGGVVQDLWVFA